MRQKMITLDPTTWEIAQKMPNFSAWVRKKLVEDSNAAAKDVPIYYHCSECDRVSQVNRHPLLDLACANGCSTSMTWLKGWTEEQVKGLIE